MVVSIPIPPEDGEYLWDEVFERWVPLVKNEFGLPQVEESINNAQIEKVSDDTST